MEESNWAIIIVSAVIFMAVICLLVFLKRRSMTRAVRREIDTKIQEEYAVWRQAHTEKLKEIPLRVVIRTPYTNKTCLESSMIGELVKAGVTILSVTDELSREIMLNNHSVKNLPEGSYVLTGFNLTRAEQGSEFYNIDLRLVCVGEGDSEVFWGKSGYFSRTQPNEEGENHLKTLKDVADQIAIALVRHHTNGVPLLQGQTTEV